MDIDIPVILVGSFGQSEHQILIDNGTGKNRKIIRIDSSTLTNKEQKALVGFHAFTGNDYVSSFMRKSKKTWKMAVKDADIIDFFCQLGEADLTDDLHKKAEVFVCKMYGHKKINSVNELRSYMF